MKLRGNAIFLALALATAIVSGWAGLGLAQDSEEGSSMDCSEDDLVYELINEIEGDPPGGPKEAKKALDDFVEETYPGLSSDDFKAKGEQNKDEDGDGKKEAKFEHDKDGDGDPKVVAGLEEHGDSWYIDTFSACNNVLVDATEGGQQ